MYHLLAQADEAVEQTTSVDPSSMDYSSAQSSLDPATAAMAATVSGVIGIVGLVVGIFFLICNWKLFSKAGKPGWASLIPIYNTIVMLEIVGRPIWWIVLLFIPFVNLIIGIILMLDLAKAFGRGSAFAIFGLLLFPYIGIPMLAFGGSKYVGPVAESAAPTTIASTSVEPPAPVAEAKTEEKK
jgi:hypothetical protein